MKHLLRILLIFIVLLMSGPATKGQKVSRFSNYGFRRLPDINFATSGLYSFDDFVRSDKVTQMLLPTRRRRSTDVKEHNHSRTGRCFGLSGDNETDDFRKKPSDSGDPFDIDPRINDYKSFFYNIFRSAKKPSLPENSMPNVQPYPYQFFVQN